MKVANLMKSLLAILCTVALAVNFTSCEEDADDLDTVLIYRASGSISGDGGALFAITDYSEAINEIVGDIYSSKAMDKEVVAACDVVYQNHKAKHPTWSGSVKIEKSKINISGDIVSSTTLKTYKYDKSE